jgi:alpha-glucosidase (family GH31 glycosyl hydrolase)
MQGRIVHGQNPLQLIERYTQAIGRMRELPDWILEGAIVGMQGGSQAVREMWKELESADVPISAFWLQVRMIHIKKHSGQSIQESTFLSAYSLHKHRGFTLLVQSLEGLGWAKEDRHRLAAMVELGDR